MKEQKVLIGNSGLIISFDPLISKIGLMQIVWKIKFMDLDLESEVNWVSQRIGSDLLVFRKLLMDLKMLKLLAFMQMEIVVQHYLVSPLKFSLV